MRDLIYLPSKTTCGGGDFVDYVAQLRQKKRGQHQPSISWSNRQEGDLFESQTLVVCLCQQQPH
jgi:hypothetical protein